MSQAILTTLRRQLGEWARQPANRRFLQQDQEAQLRGAIGELLRRPQALVAAWLLGTFYLGNGMVRVLDGDAEGFDEARVGQGLRRCSLLLRAQHAAATRGPSRLPFSRQHGAWTALLGLALHDPGVAPLHKLLLDEAETSFRADEALPLFTRALLALHAGQRPSLTPRLGIYHEVLLHWQSEPRLFAQGLAAALDAHLDGARHSGGPFDDPACRLYPVEVLATKVVRESLGLPMPKVDHPLMFTNLGTMAPRTPWPQHDLVRQLERELRRR